MRMTREMARRSSDVAHWPSPPAREPNLFALSLRLSCFKARCFLRANPNRACVHAGCGGPRRHPCANTRDL